MGLAIVTEMRVERKKGYSCVPNYAELAWERECAEDFVGYWREYDRTLGLLLMGLS